VTLVLRYAARSDRGLVRANNEDSVYAGARLLALADGMGGHAAGEVASQLVIAALAHLDDDEPGGDLLGKLEAAVRAGNSAIAAQVEMEPDLEGMGTTLTAILFAGNRLGLVHIGDSRGYLLRDGELTQITKDDTFVQTLVDEGRITAEEAHSHPQRSLIMRALTGHEVEPTLTMREARAGDRYLLCSDGLSDPVSDETILEALQIPDVAESAYRLIELALRGGGPDNVTVVVADVVDYDYGQTQPILAGAVSGEDDQQVTLPNTAAGRASAINPRKEVAKRLPPQVDSASRSRWSRRRMGFVIAVVVLLVLAGMAIGRWVIRNNYYVAEYNGMVSIVRGIQGSLLSISLHEPYLVACLNARNELSLISYGQSGGHLDCQLMTLQDLSPAGQVQVQGGLPGGTLDQAESQLRKLLADSLLTCPPPRATSPPGPSTTAPTSGTPSPSVTASPASTMPPATTSSGSTTPTIGSTSSPATASPAPPAVTTPATTSQTVPAIPHCRAVA
jgi:serine/threonine protein phosphatase PrpC